jgi:hypothetical protein
MLRLLVPILILLIAGDGRAQSTGNLAGNVTSDEGNALADVSATLAGPGGSQTRKTNDSGQFRVLGIAPGSYHVTAKLPGYSDVTVPAPIKEGQNTIDIKMIPDPHLRQE